MGKYVLMRIEKSHLGLARRWAIEDPRWCVLCHFCLVAFAFYITI